MQQHALTALPACQAYMQSFEPCFLFSLCTSFTKLGQGKTSRGNLALQKDSFANLQIAFDYLHLHLQMCVH